jgi:hypothetical protein
LSHKLPLAINIAMTPANRLVLIAPLLAILALAGDLFAGPRTGVAGKMVPAGSVEVTGKLLTHTGQPVANRSIHFENVVSGDTYLTHTGADGSFAAALPPAVYNLREEPGPIVMRNLQALTTPINLGAIAEPGSWWDILEGEKVAPGLVHSPASVTSSVRPGGPIQPALRSLPSPAP